jgi:hypothetical protein
MCPFSLAKNNAFITLNASHYTGSLRSFCECLRGHITRTPRATEKAQAPNSTSGYVDMTGKSRISQFFTDL